MAAGLLSGLLLMPIGTANAAAKAAGGTAPGARDLVGSWLTRLEQRATELETAPKVKATRIGYGMVLKKGDGGMVDVVVPGPVQPAAGWESAPVPVTPVSAEAVEPAPEIPATIAAGPPPPPLTLPMRARSADRVGRVATRLIELGHLAPEQWTEAFDDTLEAAVRSFQVAEGLMPDGKVGEVTRQALDRTPKEAATLMRNAAVALKAFQPSVPETVLLVNLPSQTVTYIERGKLVFTMRAVVGRPSRQTPLLQDRVTSVTINPTWTVPPTVLVEDKLPVLRKKGNTGIKDAIVYLDGAEVVPETVNWWSVDPGRIRIVQRPGDNNALGRFRFNLTNGEGIFLHGTNDPKLFDRDLRAASSGCVRLADARQVAETLLRAAKLDSPAIERQLESGQTKTIGLPSAVPVRFVYWTATVEPEGTVRVHPGIYDEPPAPPAPASTATVKRLEPKPIRTLPTPPAPAAGQAQLLPAAM
ncbi:L,D-transpeptidase family protein [Azospirillum sp. sgz301742]